MPKKRLSFVRPGTSQPIFYLQCTSFHRQSPRPKDTNSRTWTQSRSNSVDKAPCWRCRRSNLEMDQSSKRSTWDDVDCPPWRPRMFFLWCWGSLFLSPWWWFGFDRSGNQFIEMIYEGTFHFTIVARNRSFLLLNTFVGKRVAFCISKLEKKNEYYWLKFILKFIEVFPMKIYNLLNALGPIDVAFSPLWNISKTSFWISKYRKTLNSQLVFYVRKWKSVCAKDYTADDLFHRCSECSNKQ